MSAGTVSPMTLLGFLLDRIADDEAVARDLPEFEGATIKSRLMLEFDDDYLKPVAIVIDPVRVLAECAAKRAIVEGCREDHEGSLTAGDDTRSLATEVLMSLASVYADHDEYRSEWT